MNTPQEQVFESRGDQWFVVDPSGNLIPIDTAIVDVTYSRPGRVRGYVVAIHGLDQEIAKHMEGRTLRALGVGAQLRRAPMAKSRRGQLGKAGNIDWI